MKDENADRIQSIHALVSDVTRMLLQVAMQGRVNSNMRQRLIQMLQNALDQATSLEIE